MYDTIKKDYTVLVKREQKAKEEEERRKQSEEAEQRRLLDAKKEERLAEQARINAANLEKARLELEKQEVHEFNTWKTTINKLESIMDTHLESITTINKMMTSLGEKDFGEKFMTCFFDKAVSETWYRIYCETK